MKMRSYAREAILREMAEREPHYERYIAPQKEFANGAIEIDYSEFGKHLGEQRNVYSTTLYQNRMKQSIGNIDLSLDLYSILSISERDFSLKFLTSDHNGHRMGEMIIDGELSGHIMKKLEDRIERVTAGDLSQFILCRRIIHWRIFIERRQDWHAEPDQDP